MGSHIHGEAMPTHLRQATVESTVSVVGFLQGVLRYCALDRASHGWARMCMYQASDAMDTLGRLTGVIAAQLADNGLNRQAIQHLLRAEDEHLRTAQPPQLPELLRTSHDLAYMPPWLYDWVQRSVAKVLLLLRQMVKESQDDRNEDWFGHCLYQLTSMLDELGRLNTAIAAVNADSMSHDALARYQHLFQQRSRSRMPDANDERYLAGLLGRPGDGEATTWYSIGLVQAGRKERTLRRGSPEGRVLHTLEALDAALRPFRWDDARGRPLDRTRDTAIIYLDALTAIESEGDDDFPPLYWLPLHEQAAAAAAATVIFGAAALPGPVADQMKDASGAEGRR